MSDSLGQANLRTVGANGVLAGLYFQTDQYSSAAEKFQQIVQSNAALTGPESVRTLTSRLSLGVARQYAGDFAGGCQELSAALGSAKSALAWNHPLVEGIRYHLADCLLDQEKTSGVDLLLADLTPEVLYREQLEPDWEGRLAYQAGRLALYTGDNRRAVPLLERAADVIAAKNPDGRIDEATVRTLIQKAKTPRGHQIRHPEPRHE
jgi:non-specific serine/threonine protein kinase